MFSLINVIDTNVTKGQKITAYDYRWQMSMITVTTDEVKGQNKVLITTDRKLYQSPIWYLCFTKWLNANSIFSSLQNSNLVVAVNALMRTASIVDRAPSNLWNSLLFSCWNIFDYVAFSLSCCNIFDFIAFLFSSCNIFDYALSL